MYPLYIAPMHDVRHEQVGKKQNKKTKKKERERERKKEKVKEDKTMICYKHRFKRYF